MPQNKSAVRFIACSANSYENLHTYDENTLYFITDAQQIYVGGREYTKSVTTLQSQPNNSTQGEDGRIYVYNGSLYMCQVGVSTYTWTRIANVNDCDGTVTQITAGSGLTGGTITDAGTISHAVPVGANSNTDDLNNQSPEFGNTFQIVGVSTDEFGHVTGVNLHTVTLPNETEISLSSTSEDHSQLENEGTFEVVIDIEKGNSSHELTFKKQTIQLPKSVDKLTYSISAGDQSGSVKLVSSDGKTTEAVIKDWDKISELVGVTSVFTYKGKVQNVEALPKEGMKTGDVYHIEETGQEYVYIADDDGDSGHWENLGGIDMVDLEGYALSKDVIPRVNDEDAQGKVPIITSDGALTSSNHTLEADVPSDAKFTDTVYTHPKFTQHALGLYSIEINDEGHINVASKVTKKEIVDLGIPEENTDTKVTLHPNSTSKIYLAGHASPNESTDELQVSTRVFIDENGGVNAGTFHGKADTAAKAEADSSGNNIENTYLSKNDAEDTYAKKSDVESFQLTWQVF